MMPNVTDRLFEVAPGPRVFAMPPGVDFAAMLVDGVRARCAGRPPEAMAQIRLYLNSARMKQMVEDQFHQGPPCLLPRIRLITQIPDDFGLPLRRSPAPALRRRLELRELVARLVDASPNLAPLAAIPDLTDTLASLLEEMEDEGVQPCDVLGLETGDQSGHWQEIMKFLAILAQFADADSSEAPSPARHFRLRALELANKWAATPPDHPVIIAGSTASRGTTSMIMQAVARLPDGAVILPGFDRHQSHVWSALAQDRGAQDHPQYRFARFMADLDMSEAQVADWPAPLTRAQLERNKLVSLSLRPAPVTDEWRRAAPDFADIDLATADMSLVLADSPRHEALSVALAIRDATERGEKVALITPDQSLTRQVTATLNRWDITPDASIGQRLSRTAPGQLMRMILAHMHPDAKSKDLITLLKHPLVSQGANRGVHIELVRLLELWVRRKAVPHLGPSQLAHWADKIKGDMAEKASIWVTYWADHLFGPLAAGPLDLRQRLDHHITIAKALVSGPWSEDTTELFAKPSGKALDEFWRELTDEAGYSGPLRADEYAALIENFLAKLEARDPLIPRESVKIWGTLEARVQSADLVILGGLNQGVWPEQPGADPWLNRAMRLEAGLRLPDRAIGLSAHDYQQAIAAKRVILSRATRDDEADTVASRWLNRLGNLMGGLSDQSKAAFDGMVDRGAHWAALARRLDVPDETQIPAPRPAPAPPEKARPRQLSVTDIEKLIRDPYAIYARKVLRLRPLDPLNASADFRLRGIVLHAIFEDAVRTLDFGRVRDTSLPNLEALAQGWLDRSVPWPDVRILWAARLFPSLAHFVETETARQQTGKVLAMECEASLHLKSLDFTLTAKADRIDRLQDGRAAIYDYKSSVPTAKEVKVFNKQLALEAIMLEAGAFKDLAAMDVATMAYIAVLKSAEVHPRPLVDTSLSEERGRLEKLLRTYLDEDKGFGAMRAMKSLTYGSDYAHLARHGEWDETDAFALIRVT